MDDTTTKYTLPDDNIEDVEANNQDSNLDYFRTDEINTNNETLNFKNEGKEDEYSDYNEHEGNTIDFDANSEDLSGVDNKDILALMKVVSGESMKVEDLGDIPRAIAKIVPSVIERLVSEYESLFKKYKDQEQKLMYFASVRDAQKDVFRDALSSDKYNIEKYGLLSVESRNIVSDYISMKVRMRDTEERINRVLSDLQEVSNFVSNFPSGNKIDLDISGEFDELVKNVEKSLAKIDASVKNDLYTEISDALENGHSDTLPQDLLDLIQQVVIDRLENVLKPYEELSSKYVSGELSHAEFTNSLRQNALFSHLREKVVADIIREYENNNITSPIVPTRLRLATERMISDAKNFAKMMNFPAENGSVKVYNTESTVQGTNSGSFSLDDN